MKAREIFCLSLIWVSMEGYSKEKVVSKEDLEPKKKVIGVVEEEREKVIKFYSFEKEYRQLETCRIQLEKARALELKPIVESMLSIYGSVYVNEKENSIYITDTPEMMESLKEIVSQLDSEGIVAGGNFVSKLILLKHTKASDMIGLVKHKLSKDGEIFEVGDLNGLIITDIFSKIGEVEALIRELDLPIRHLAIEITVVELNLEHYKKIGLDIFGWLDKMYPEIRYEKEKEEGKRYGYEHKDDEERFYFTLPPQFNISDLIELMIRDGKGKVIASPRIITKNNNRAYLDASEMIPYLSDRDYYGSRERTARVGVYISVLPIIQQDNFINLSISPRISDLAGWSPEGMPIIFERSLETEVNVKDGETFILGGLRKTEKVKLTKGIPILKEIFLLKYLFSKTVEVNLAERSLSSSPLISLKKASICPRKTKGC
jgi:type II secretory pathway component GspD/PulD (secretin)